MKKKNASRYYHFTHVYHIDFLNMEHNRQIFLSFWMSFFFPFRKYGAGAGLLKQGGGGGGAGTFPI